MNKDRSEFNIDGIAPLAPRDWMRYDVIRRTIPAEVRSVLEIGCGCGALGVRLAQRYAYLGIEPDAAAWSIASKRINAVGVGEVRNILSNNLSDGQFDMVCAFEVLEHIEHDAAALEEWISHVRPGGWLMLSVPADQQRYGPWDALGGHFRRYDPSEITALLARSGVTDIIVRRYDFPLGILLGSIRNMIGQYHLANAPASLTERTAASGRQFRPNSLPLGLVCRWGTAPFRRLQRLVPWGTGLVILAQTSDCRL